MPQPTTTKREYKPEDWEIHPWPDPPSGDPDDYGPTPMQQQLFIYHYEPWERPHFHNVDVVLLLGGSGSGKSWKRGTRVLLATGQEKNVEDIIVGDVLLGPNGEKRTVLSLGRGREKFYKVTPTKGESFECNESHILSLKKSGADSEYRFNPVSKTIYRKPPRYGCHSGDIVNVPIKEYLTWSDRKKSNFKLYRSPGVDFHNEFKSNSLIDPYMLGVWLGDGHSNKFSITSMDGEIMDATIEYANKQRLPYRLEDSPSKAITIHVNGAMPILRQFNLLNNKHIPDCYKLGSKEVRLNLLAGLIDTDGSYDRGGIDFIQKNESLARDFAFLCRSLGLAAYVTPCQKSCQTGNGKFTGNYFRVSVSGDLTSIPTRLPRKQALAREQIKDVLVTGFSLEEMPEDDYYGFTIDGDHLFLLSDFTVVHNSICSIAEIIELAASFPLCAATIGGKNMPLLKRNVISKFGERLSWVDGKGMRHKWAHPVVSRAPSQHNPVCELVNGSTISFVNIDDDDVVRGFTGDVFLIEEVNLMDADSLREMLRRSRGNALPIRQFILNMNPTGTRDWVFDMFALEQLKKDYEGPKVDVGPRCKCEFCHACNAQDMGNHKWVGGNQKHGPNGKFYEWEGGECPNPSCPTLVANNKRGKPGLKQKKTNLCPGNQVYYRVIRSASWDNPHNPSDYVELQKGALSPEEYANYVKGEIVEVRAGFIYKNFTDRNLMEIDLDPEKDIYWTHDFNFNPMSSLICQDIPEGLGVVDELIIWNADEAKVANAFVAKYKNFKNTIYIYGDPAGLNPSRHTSGKSSFKVLYDILKNAGLKVEMGVKKIKGETQIPIRDRINGVSAVIKTMDGTARLFVDPKCGNLLASLRNVQWCDKGEFKEDEKCDVNARTNPKREIQPVVMTHPQAALGYLVHKIRPFLLQRKGIRMIETIEKSVVVEEKSVVITNKYPQEPEEHQVVKTNGPVSDIFGIYGNLRKERAAAEAIEIQAYEDKLRDKLLRLGLM